MAEPKIAATTVPDRKCDVFLEALRPNWFHDAPSALVQNAVVTPESDRYGVLGPRVESAVDRHQEASPATLVRTGETVIRLTGSTRACRCRMGMKMASTED